MKANDQLRSLKTRSRSFPCILIASSRRRKPRCFGMHRSLAAPEPRKVRKGKRSALAPAGCERTHTEIVALLPDQICQLDGALRERETCPGSLKRSSPWYPCLWSHARLLTPPPQPPRRTRCT